MKSFFAVLVSLVLFSGVSFAACMNDQGNGIEVVLTLDTNKKIAQTNDFVAFSGNDEIVISVGSNYSVLYRDASVKRNANGSLSFKLKESSEYYLELASTGLSGILPLPGTYMELSSLSSCTLADTLVIQ